MEKLIKIVKQYTTKPEPTFKMVTEDELPAKLAWGWSLAEPGEEVEAITFVEVEPEQNIDVASLAIVEPAAKKATKKPKKKKR